MRRIAHSKIDESCSSRTTLSNPCTRKTRPKRQTVRSTSGKTYVPVSSSTTSPPARVRLREMSPLPLRRSPCGASTGESDPASSRLKSFSRGRAPRFLRKSVRSLPFFFAIRSRVARPESSKGVVQSATPFAEASGRASPAILYRFVRQLDLASLHVRRIIAAGGARIACAFALNRTVVQASTRQKRFLHDFL